MLATGGLFVAIALLTLAAVTPLFRSDNPPRWTTRGWVGELVTLGIVCTLAIGVGYLGAGAIDAFQTGADYLDLGLLVVVLLVLVVLWRRLNARRKAAAVDASVHALAPGSGRAHSDTLVAGAEPAPVTASAPPPPHKAA
jgi:choline-glycine betaine transporter